MEDLRNEFPVLSNYTYLNTASCGLISKSLVAWRGQQDKMLCEEASVFRDLHKQHIKSIRSTVARFIGAGEHEVALVPNFSFGLNTLLEGIPKQKKVLLLGKDYPSISWPFESRGFAICHAEIDENLEANIEQAITEHQPDIFAFSLVQYLNGIKINFDFLKQLKAYHPNLLLIADGTQYLGTETFNFHESPLDVLGASCYKWMLAGYGNGLFLIKEDAQSLISPLTIGFNSADAVFGKWENIPFIKRLEPGHQDTLNYGSLEQAIFSLESIGMDTISGSVSKIVRLAKDKFAELGLLEESVVKRDNHSNIFNLKGDAVLFQKLKENGIICSLRDKGIRVSFHFYNKADDLDQLCKLLI